MQPIQIPDELSHLPVYRGIPIPHVVLIDNEGNPNFKINNEPVNIQCIEKRICHICGKPLNGEFWFIGGQLSAFHPRGAFNDGAMHKVCGLFALRTCPYMLNVAYKPADWEGLKKMAQDIAGKVDGVEALYNPTQTNARLPFFCFVKAKDYKVNVHAELQFIRTVSATKPYLEIEYWMAGEQITPQQARETLRLRKEHCHLPK